MADEQGKTESPNRFKQAINLFLFGSTDPSLQEAGEARARSIQQRDISTALALTAGQDPTTRATVVNAYAGMGAESAKAMRERYYQAEYRQIYNSHIKPVQDDILTAEEELKARLAITNRPVPRVVTPEEGQMVAEQLQGQEPTPTTVKVGTTKEGKPKEKLIDQPAPPAPNPAMGQGQLGGVQYMPETPVFTDPMTGETVPIASQRGIAIQEEAFDSYWNRVNRGFQSMMDAYAQYQGNPFVGRAQEHLLKSVSNMAGSAVTGRVDRQKQQEWWEGRQKFEADLEAKQQETSSAALQLQVDQSKIQAAANDGRALAQTDEAFRQQLPPKLLKKLDEGKPLTTKETTNLAADARYFRELQKERFDLQRQAGLTTIPPERLTKPTTWYDWISTNDRSYQNKVVEAQNELITKFSNQLEQAVMGGSELKEEFIATYNVPEAVAVAIRAGNITDKAVAEWVELQVALSPQYQEQKDIAYLDRMSIVGREQPEVEQMVDRSNDTWLNEYMQHRADTGKSPLSEAAIEEMRADRWRTHLLSVEGRKPPDWRDPFTAARVRSVRSKYEATRRGGPQRAAEEAKQAVRTPKGSAPTKEERQKFRGALVSPKQMSDEEITAQMKQLWNVIDRKAWRDDAERMMWAERYQALEQERGQRSRAAVGEVLTDVGKFVAGPFYETEDEKKERAAKAESARRALTTLPKVN